MTSAAGRVISAALLSGCVSAEVVREPDLEPIATPRQIMLTITIPHSDVVWAAQNEAPADEAGWVEIENSAAALAESGNLLLIRGVTMDAAYWSEAARALVEASRRAGTAARARDLDNLIAAGDAAYETCVACHQGYRGS